MSNYLRITCAAAVAACAAYAQPALASGEIVGAVSAVVNSGGTASALAPISNTFDQTGLSTTYISGSTNYNTYIAGNPQHDFVFTTEWFSNFGTSSASVTYNLGSVLGIDALALWNEDGDGIGTLNLYGSAGGTAFSLLGTFNPTDNPLGAFYGPQSFTFNRALVQYLRLDMSGCPQDTQFPACSIGQVAFRTALVPEPSTWALMILGFGAFGVALRRERKMKIARQQPA